MLKEVAEQVETRGRGRKLSHSRDMLSVLEGRKVNPKESMRDTKETLEMMGGRIKKLGSEKDSVLDALKALLNTTVAKLTEKNETLEAIMMVMKADNEATVAELHTKIEELKGELALVLGGKPSRKVDAPKPEKFKGARSTREVDNFLWEIK
ncbi:cyclin-D4-1-like [Gossypium australe]|uniref:Cyclin-D4-1-like n=1 Tax=Gossypium australe TaxID=47621 RepID=A0A5B6UXM7_9ROSI|nr:cyclin-D4-1-like [Gossypium australe]